MKGTEVSLFQALLLHPAGRQNTRCGVIINQWDLWSRRLTLDPIRPWHLWEKQNASMHSIWEFWCSYCEIQLIQDWHEGTKFNPKSPFLHMSKPRIHFLHVYFADVTRCESDRPGQENWRESLFHDDSLHAFQRETTGELNIVVEWADAFNTGEMYPLHNGWFWIIRTTHVAHFSYSVFIQ